MLFHVAQMPPASRVKDLDGDKDDEARIPLVPLRRSRSRPSVDLDADLLAIERELHQDGHYKRQSEDDEGEGDRKAGSTSALHGPSLEDMTSEAGTDTTLAMVRSVVKETDDPSLPCITFRVLLLGSMLCAVGAAISQLFFVSTRDQIGAHSQYTTDC